MTTRAGWISRLTVSTVLSLAALGASAQQTIKIGEINSYKAQPAFLGPYKNGWNLALEQVNAAGGVLGKQLEVVSRDDNGNPGDTIRVAQELIAREQVQLLFGGFLSNTGLALTDFKKLLTAAQPDVQFVAEQATPLGSVDAGAVTQALADAKPDAIFNVLFGADHGKFVREGNTRGLFKDRSVVSLLTGEPDYLDPLGAEAPAG